MHPCLTPYSRFVYLLKAFSIGMQAVCRQLQITWILPCRSSFSIISSRSSPLKCLCVNTQYGTMAKKNHIIPPTHTHTLWYYLLFYVNTWITEWVKPKLALIRIKNWIRRILKTNIELNNTSDTLKNVYKEGLVAWWLRAIARKKLAVGAGQMNPLALLYEI